MQWKLGVVGLLWVFSPAKAVDNWDVEGAHGVLRVSGALTESACRLAMSSRYQDIHMGETSTAKLRRSGDRGTPVAVYLRLEDCLRTPTHSRDERTGNMAWSIDQPAVAISFSSAADSDNPQLIKVQGVSGIGLRLVQYDGKPVVLGHRNQATLLTAGNNILAYKLMPERTSAPLIAGAYHAIMDFQLIYD